VGWKVSVATVSAESMLNSAIRVSRKVDVAPSAR
jgi:hypothetical protein